MRLAGLLALALSASVALAAAPPAAAPAPNPALFGRAWGEAPPAAARPLRSEPEHGRAMYDCAPAERKLLGVAVQNVYCVYELGALSGVSIRVLAADKDALQFELEKLWGAPESEASGSLRWFPADSWARLRRLPPPNDGSFTLNLGPGRGSP
ncbi:MAG: hypothetical protein KBD01_20220 [Acidobacteria bacterium]|nr:hypothetical protein [Acidobacteriota bacterium]